LYGAYVRAHSSPRAVADPIAARGLPYRDERGKLAAKYHDFFLTFLSGHYTGYSYHLQVSRARIKEESIICASLRLRPPSATAVSVRNRE
jgi:hypothetical protein